MKKITLNTLDRIVREFGVKLVQMNEQYALRHNLGEDQYKNCSYICGNDEIFLGEFDDPEIWLISFFHELGHHLLPDGFWSDEVTKYQMEEECWRLGLQEATKRGFSFSSAAKTWGFEQLKTYLNWEQREVSGYNKPMVSQPSCPCFLDCAISKQCLSGEA